MTAASKNRNTPQQASNCRPYAVGANVRCFAGAIAVLDGGLCVPGRTAVGLTAVGRFAFEVNNLGGAAGDATVEVERGCFRYENSAGADEITAADVGKFAYVVDDQTVARTDGGATRSIAGFIDHVDDVGVWVSIDPTSGASA